MNVCKSTGDARKGAGSSRIDSEHFWSLIEYWLLVILLELHSTSPVEDFTEVTECRRATGFYSCLGVQVSEFRASVAAPTIPRFRNSDRKICRLACGTHSRHNERLINKFRDLCFACR